MGFSFKYTLEVMPALLGALWVTVLATVLGMVLALALGLGWTLLRRSPKIYLRWPAEWLVEFVRSTPFLVQAYFLFYVVPGFGLRMSPLATGILALGLHYSAYTSEAYRAGVNGVARGQWEAGHALGLSPFAMWLRVILPQAIPPAIPSLGNYVIAMFKDTPMLSAITVMELLNTAKMLGAESFRYKEPLTVVGVLFLALSLLSAWGVRVLEKRLMRVRAT